MKEQKRSKLRSRDIELIEHLKEDNLSLRYQVEKLQLALKKVLLVENRHKVQAAIDDIDEHRRLQQHIHKLESFMNENANENIALKGRLKGASTYISKLEDDRSRLSEEVQTLRAEIESTSSTPLSASKLSPTYKIKHSPDGLVREALESAYSKSKSKRGSEQRVGEYVASNLAAAFAKAQGYSSNQSPLDYVQSRAKQKSSISLKKNAAQKEPVAVIKTSSISRRRTKKSLADSGIDDSTRESPPASQRSSPIILTSEDLAYIMTEVTSLKLKMSKTEAQLKSTQVESPSNISDDSIKDDLRDMKQSQGVLMEQVKGQQQALSQIVRLVSLMRSPNSEGVVDGEQGLFSKHMSQTSVRGRTFDRFPIKEKRSPKLTKQERKLALLNAGYSCAQIDDDLLVEKGYKSFHLKHL